MSSRSKRVGSWDRADCWSLVVHFAVVFGTVWAVYLNPFIIDDSVIAGIFQAYVMLIIFAASAPEFLLESIGRSEVRELVRDTFKFSKSGRRLLVFLFLGAVSCVCHDLLEESLDGDGWMVARATTVSITSSLSATILSVLFYVRNLRPEKIALRLGAELRGKRYNRGSRAKTDGASKCFRSLSALGRAARTAEEHESILLCFQDTIADVIESEGYNGDALEMALGEMVAAATENFHLTTSGDVARGLEFIDETKMKVVEAKPRSVDSRRGREALQKTASFILDAARDNPRGNYEGVVERAIWALDDEPAAQFALLRRTLETGRPVTLMKVAVRLHAYYRGEDRGGRGEDRFARLLAFVAMLRQRGRSEKRWVEEQIVTGLDVELGQALDGAHERMYTAGEFQAADALDRWREELRGQSPGGNPGTWSAPLVSLSFSLFGPGGVQGRDAPDPAKRRQPNPGRDR